MTPETRNFAFKSRESILDDFTDFQIGMRDRWKNALPDRFSVRAAGFHFLETYFDYVESRIHPIKTFFYRIETRENALFE